MAKAMNRGDDRREALEFERISSTDLAVHATATPGTPGSDDASGRPTVSFRRPTIGDAIQMKKGQV